MVPEDSDAGAVLWAMSQVFEYWLLAWRSTCCEAESWTEQMDSCYQGARLYEANDECTEDEAEAGQGLLLIAVV